MQVSKFQVMMKDTSSGYLRQQLHSHPCPCKLCVQNVRPIVDSPQPRQTSDREYKLKQIPALSLILQKCVAQNHPRILFVPDMYIIQDSLFCYTNEQSCRLRVKENISSYQAKRLFQDRRKKLTKNSQYLLTSFSKDKSRQRDNIITVVYCDGNRQIINEIQLKKIFAKRKSDSFWSEAAAIYYIPQTRDQKITFQYWEYFRNADMVAKMKKITQSMGQQIDNYDEKVIMDDTLRNNVSMMQQMNISQFSMVSIDQSKGNYSKIPINASIHLSNVPLQKSTILSQKYPIQETLLELVAYIQLASSTRLLSARFEYMFDEQGRPYLTGVNQLIAVDLKSSQTCYLHDRYKSLENIQNEEIIRIKKQFDEQDAKILWNVCTQILIVCLQQRKRKLKLMNYVKPQKQNLKQIFLRFFPEFNAETMLSNMNWKNQLANLMDQWRDHINRIIKQDEGISILKRYGIIFYRTFD